MSQAKMIVEQTIWFVVYAWADWTFPTSNAPRACLHDFMGDCLASVLLVIYSTTRLISHREESIGLPSTINWTSHPAKSACVCGEGDGCGCCYKEEISYTFACTERFSESDCSGCQSRNLCWWSQRCRSIPFQTQAFGLFCSAFVIRTLRSVLFLLFCINGFIWPAL